jgi:hypothetical protein
MAIIKRVWVDRVEVLENGNLQVRTAAAYIEDGVQGEKTFSRKVVAPGDDLSGEDELVRDVGQGAHTPERIEVERVRRSKDPAAQAEDHRRKILEEGAALIAEAEANAASNTGEFSKEARIEAGLASPED